jgi:hypothetical protein
VLVAVLPSLDKYPLVLHLTEFLADNHKQLSMFWPVPELMRSLSLSLTLVVLAPLTMLM